MAKPARYPDACNEPGRPSLAIAAWLRCLPRHRGSRCSRRNRGLGVARPVAGDRNLDDDAILGQGRLRVRSVAAVATAAKTTILPKHHLVRIYTSVITPIAAAFFDWKRLTSTSNLVSREIKSGRSYPYLHVTKEPDLLCGLP
jgi:hypothetical protein